MLILKNLKKFTDTDKEELWAKYLDSPEDKEVFNLLTEAYLPVVEVIAAKMKSNLPPYMDIDDLVSTGYLGLREAIERYDSSMGYKFETYATMRIKGYILDSLREKDRIPRALRGKFKKMGDTELALLEELQREPTSEELADRLDWSLNDLNEVRRRFQESFEVNLDEFISDSTHESFSLEESIADLQLGESADQLSLDDMKDTLAEGLAQLSEQEVEILLMVLAEKKKFVDIQKETGILAPQVVKIYDGALKELGEYFK